MGEMRVAELMAGGGQSPKLPATMRVALAETGSSVSAPSRWAGPKSWPLETTIRVSPPPTPLGPCETYLSGFHPAANSPARLRTTAYASTAEICRPFSPACEFLALLPTPNARGAPHIWGPYAVLTRDTPIALVSRSPFVSLHTSFLYSSTSPSIISATVSTLPRASSNVHRQTPRASRPIQ